MAAIADSFRKVVDFVMDGFRGENPFVDINEDEDYDDDGYDYVEEGSALEKLPHHLLLFPMMEKNVKKQRFLIILVLTEAANEVIVVEPRSFDDAATIVQHLKDRKIVMLKSAPVG